MNKPLVYFVKANPPPSAFSGHDRSSGPDRYDWEPMTLRLLAHRLIESHGDRLEIQIFHLRNEGEAIAFIHEVETKAPILVAFSELDLLVSSVNRLAARCKTVAPECMTVVGGKHASLLSAGDPFPYSSIDVVVSGCGVEPLRSICDLLLEGRKPSRTTGQVIPGADGMVAEVIAPAVRDNLQGIDGAALRSTLLVGPTEDEFLERIHNFPAQGPRPQRLATVLWSTGCIHSCSFCQSPVERARDGQGCVQRPVSEIAAEIEWLVRKKQVTAIFALAANLDLGTVERLYLALASHGIDGIPICGFVRAADVVAAFRSGLLKRLSDMGMGTLSIGIDASARVGKTDYSKGFDYSVSRDCFDACLAVGIPASATALGDTRLKESDFRAELDALIELPLLSVDIRLATAFRGSVFARENMAYTDASHTQISVASLAQRLELNDYRHITITSPGSIAARAVISAVSDFQAEFAVSPARARYAKKLVSARPSLASMFRPQPERMPADYDRVARLYDAAFADIRVRHAEWDWLSEKMGKPSNAGAGRRIASPIRVRQPTLLEVGCGTGSLLRALSDRVAKGVGVDVSEAMLDRARARSAHDQKLSFTKVRDWQLPFPDAAFDIVVSFLSYRYLDWERIPAEIRRVLRPEGRFLCVDMVASPLRPIELPRFALDSARDRLKNLRNTGFKAALAALVADPDWEAMRSRNPARGFDAFTEHALKTWGAIPKVLSIGREAKILAFEGVP